MKNILGFEREVIMIERLEVYIWDYCGENEVLAFRLSSFLYFFFWWTLSGSFRCWLLGHKYKRVNNSHVCVHCDQHIELINNPGRLEIRLFERLLSFFYSKTFEH